MEVGAALGKLVDALDGATVCVEVGAALGKLVVETRSAWKLERRWASWSGRHGLRGIWSGT